MSEVVTATPPGIPKDGPFQLVRVEHVPFDGKGLREGIWRVSWEDSSMLFSGWDKACDWLDDKVAKRHIDEKAVILAGPYSVPWVLEWYLVAAAQAEQNDRMGVFDSYSKSASLLLGENSEYSDVLTSPWVDQRANRAAS